jgi:PKD repeat protein
MLLLILSITGGYFCEHIAAAEINGDLSVDPVTKFSSSGEPGGPFLPPSIIYSLTNRGSENINWQVSKSESWLESDATSGVMEPGSTVDVTVRITDQANDLAIGEHTDTIEFTNATTGSGTTTRKAVLQVQPAYESMTTANRTSGIAPLGVFFDAHSDASGVIQPTDNDHTKFHYAWDFGDDPSETWATTGGKKNEGSGYVAAHVYENPGAYRVKLTVTDEQGNKHYYAQDINVSEFSGTTFYISSSQGSDLNNGLVPSEPLRTFSKALSMAGANRRFLFKRGDQWTLSNGALIAEPGPGIIGAYGEGTKPIIRCTGPGTVFDFRGRDWRIMDLELAGPGNSSQMAGIEGNALAQHLALRLKVRNFRLGIAYSWSGALVHAENIIADCEFSENIVNNGYLGGSKIAVLGSRFEGADVSHILRVWHLRKGVISNNIMDNPGGDRLALKFHNEISLSLPDSQYVIISDNRMRGHVFVVSIAPQNYTSDERISDVIFERNVLNSMSDTQHMLLVIAQRVTIRNNVINGHNASSYFIGIDVTPSQAPGSTDHHIYNNTVFYDENSEEFTAVKVHESSMNVIVRNNLASAPQVEGAKMLAGGGTGLQADHNLLTDNAGFVDPASGNFSLTAGSAGIDAGLAIPEVKDSFNGAMRPRGEAYDIGAYEQ